MSDTTPGSVYAKAKKRRGYSTLKARDPHDREFWELLLADIAMDETAKRGRGAALQGGDGSLGATQP